MNNKSISEVCDVFLYVFLVCVVISGIESIPNTFSDFFKNSLLYLLVWFYVRRAGRRSTHSYLIRGTFAYRAFVISQWGLGNWVNSHLIFLFSAHIIFLLFFLSVAVCSAIRPRWVRFVRSRWRWVLLCHHGRVSNLSSTDGRAFLSSSTQPYCSS